MIRVHTNKGKVDYRPSEKLFSAFQTAFQCALKPARRAADSRWFRHRCRPGAGRGGRMRAGAPARAGGGG